MTASVDQFLNVLLKWGLEEGRGQRKSGFAEEYLPRGGDSEEPACQCRRHQRCMFDPWVRKIFWRRQWQPTPVFLPGESHGQRSLEGYGPQGHKELDTTKVT